MFLPRGKIKNSLVVFQGSLILLVFSINGGISYKSEDQSQLNTYKTQINHQKNFARHPLLGDDFSQSIDIRESNSGDETSDAPVSPGQQIRFERISIEQGLSQSSIYSIYQDSKGFLWFGTEDGLNKFDGYDFNIYRHDPDDLTSLSDNSVFSIFEDQEDVLWIGTYGRGLNRFERGSDSFTHFRHNPDDPTSIAYDSISVINNDSLGNLWIGTWNGLDRFDRESEEFIHYYHDPDDQNSLSSDVITDVHLDTRGTLWIATYGGGLNRYDPSTDKFYRYQQDVDNPYNLSIDYLTSICEDQSEYLWIGTADQGLIKLDLKSEKFEPHNFDSDEETALSQSAISSVEVDSTGRIWIGTDGAGITIFDPKLGKFQQLSHNQGDSFSISQDNVTEVFVDRSGIVWIGTFGGGINRYDPQSSRFTYYRHIPNDPDSIAANSVMSITGSDEGDIWIGILGGGLDRYDRNNGKMVHYSNDPDNPLSLSSDDVWYVYQDTSGSPWVGTYGGGLNQMDPETGEFTQYIHDPEDPDSLGLNSINVIYEDREGYLWIGTSGRGLDRLDRKSGKFIHYRNDPDDPFSLSNNRIWSITEDRTGSLWIGTGGGGISVLDQETGKFTQYLHDPGNPHSLGDTDIFSIYEDSRGLIWIGTYGSGLDKFDPSTKEFSHYRVTHGLPNNVVYGILEDDDGYLWLSTNYGLSRFDPETESFKNFDVSDGLQSNEFNVGAHYEDSNGEMFFGGINGLTSFYPGKIQDSTYLPPVVLTSLTQGGEDLSQMESLEDLMEIVLPQTNNNLEFEFVALNFAHPEKSLYAYKLDGFDQDWNMIGTSRNGRYTNLPGGTYTLLLKATNSDGVWNEDGYNLRVRVIPPFWETWWFIGIVTLVIMAGVISGYRLRIRSIEDRSKKLEEQVKLRTEEIDRRRLELEALYQADEFIDKNLTLENRLKALVDVSIEILNADKSAIFVWDEPRGKYGIKISRGFSPEAVQDLAFREDEGVIGAAAKSGGIVIVQDGKSDPRRKQESPELVDIVLAEGIRSYMFLPIKVGDEIFGIFNVSFSEPNAIGEEEKRVFMALTQHSALSIQNAQLFEQLRELAITEERSRLARDLHDSAKQKAFAALAQLGAASAIIERNPNASKEHLQEAEDLVYEVLQELIILIQEMYPVTLREMGLAATVRDYVFEWESQCDIGVDMIIHNEKRLPLETEQSLYRVIQESLANVARHSQAKNVKVSIVYNSDNVEIQISDDGIGFDVNKQPSGFGLRSMRERVDMINGELFIRSEFGKGTQISVVAPVSG